MLLLLLLLLLLSLLCRINQTLSYIGQDLTYSCYPSVDKWWYLPICVCVFWNDWQHKGLNRLSNGHDDNFYIKIQDVQDSRSFDCNLYRSIHKMFDILLSTNTAKGGWNHIWLIYSLFHYDNFPNVLWALRTMVSKNNRQMKGQSEIAYLPKFANIMLIVMVIVINEIF